MKVKIVSYTCDRNRTLRVFFDYVSVERKNEVIHSELFQLGISKIYISTWNFFRVIVWINNSVQIAATVKSI